jgi:hypothetical protein
MASRGVYRFGGLAAALCRALSVAGHAEEVDSFGGKALKPGEQHDGKVLTVDQLIACIDLRNTLKQRSRDIDSLKLQAESAESRYQSQGRLIDALRSSLDRSDQDEIDSFNAKVEEHGALIDAYNDRVDLLNQAIDEQDGMADRFNAECTKSAYYASDLTRAYSIRERDSRRPWRRNQPGVTAIHSFRRLEECSGGQILCGKDGAQRLHVLRIRDPSHAARTIRSGTPHAEGRRPSPPSAGCGFRDGLDGWRRTSLDR